MSKRAQTRSTEIAPGSFNEDSWQVRFDYSTGARVDRGIYLEDLVVSDDAIDTSRLDAGAVHLIRDHMPYGDPVGRVISHGVENGRAFAIVQLSRGEANSSTVEDIKSGVIRFCSVGYVPLETEVDDTGDRTIVTVTRWMPLEISLTPIPADIGAQTRSLPTNKTVAQKGKPMKNKVKTRATPEELETEIENLEVELDEAEADGDDEAVAEIDAEIDEVEAELEEAEDEAEAGDDAADAEDEVATDRQRSANILSLAKRNKLPIEVAMRAVERGTTEKAFRAMIKKRKLEQSPAPLPTARSRMLADERETMQRSAAVAVRDLFSRRPSEGAGQFRGMSISDLARRSIGREASMMSDEQAVRHALQMTRSGGMHSSSDFAFAHAIGAGIEMRIIEQQQNTQLYLDPIVEQTTVSNFLPVQSISVGGFPALKEIPEGGHRERGTVTNEGGSFSIDWFGSEFAYTFQAMVNDDPRILTRIVDNTVWAYAALKNKLAHEALGAKLGDGRTLFHATRGNLIANNPLDRAGLSKARKVMRDTKGIDGQPMNLNPETLVVPTDLEEAALRVTAQISPSSTDEVNTTLGQIKNVVVDPYMEEGTWILAANRMAADRIEMASLRGYEGLIVKHIEDPRTNGLIYSADTYIGAHPTGARGLVKSTS